MNNRAPVSNVPSGIKSKHHCHNQHYGPQECVQYWIGSGEKKDVHLCRGKNIGPRSVAGILCENRE
jgi:hypothetical protein